MNCPKCGAQLEEDSKFCPTCGADLTAEAEAETVDTSKGNPVQKALAAAPVFSGKKMDLTKMIGLVVGTVLIIVGLIRIFSAGTSISSTSFGGDFYTYTYRGIVAISEILASIQVSLGWVIVAIGAAIDVHSLRK